MQPASSRLADRGRRTARPDPRFPQCFACIDVSDTRDPGLIEQEGLDRRATPDQHTHKRVGGKPLGQGLDARRPRPRGRPRPSSRMRPNWRTSAKHEPRVVGEIEHARCCRAAPRASPGGLDDEAAGHAQVRPPAAGPEANANTTYFARRPTLVRWFRRSAHRANDPHPGAQSPTLGRMHVDCGGPSVPVTALARPRAIVSTSGSSGTSCVTQFGLRPLRRLLRRFASMAAV